MSASAPAPAAVALEGIAKKFGAYVALRDITLSVSAGEFICFLGPSGCGKTTLLRIIAGLERQNAGTVLMSGRDVSALPPAQRSPVMDYQYDEFELIREQDRNIYAQSILFGNGWEMRLRFSDLQVSLGSPVYPLVGTVLVPVACAVAKSA